MTVQHPDVPEGAQALAEQRAQLQRGENPGLADQPSG